MTPSDSSSIFPAPLRNARPPETSPNTRLPRSDHRRHGPVHVPCGRRTRGYLISALDFQVDCDVCDEGEKTLTYFFSVRSSHTCTSAGAVCLFQLHLFSERNRHFFTFGECSTSRTATRSGS